MSSCRSSIFQRLILERIDVSIECEKSSFCLLLLLLLFVPEFCLEDPPQSFHSDLSGHGLFVESPVRATFIFAKKKNFLGNCFVVVVVVVSASIEFVL